MALSASPRKVVPLASGDDWQPSRSNSSGHNVTKRVFFCGLVVESPDGNRRLPQDVQDLVVSFGEPLGATARSTILASSSEQNLEAETDRATQRKRAMTDASALADIINELVTTERSYVKRLHTLKHDYADPLRRFSRNKDTLILPAYEAKTLFGNVDNLLPVNEAFLADLERMVLPDGPNTVGGIGDVVLKHFKDIRGFEHYKQYYIKREEAQTIFEREMAKRSSGFAAFIDRIKYSNADTRNRVGLRELLMDPVQRIPRYTLLFRTMIKRMAPGDPQRAKLVEADEIASKIALAETDEQTKRATIMYCLSATVDGFPPGLISNSRRFIDCIDVEDVSPDVAPSASSGPPSSTGSLHCTLFLFDDKLMLVKRPGNGEKSGRVLAGLDDMEKVTKAGGMPFGLKKSGLSCKGVVDVTDVVAADVGGADIHLYLENPPNEFSDRWSGRPFRSLAVVHPPAPVYLDPTRTDADKKRFLENLWNVQATYRTKAGQSVVLCAEEREVESRGGKVTLARTYFNVYQRTAFLQEVKKTKIVVHVDPMGTADPIPFGSGGPPFVMVRLQPMAGELCRFTVTSSDPNDEGEEDIVQTTRVPARVIQTIHQFGLFKFRTGNNSLPSTPTASTRSRAAIFSLDAISRNLFNARPGLPKGSDFFGGSVNSHRRSKSSVSRSSTTTTTADSSLMKFSHRSNSTATQATTMSSTTMNDSFGASRSSRSRKLVKRSKSPGGSESERDRAPSRSRSVNGRESEPEYSDFDDDDDTVQQHMKRMDQSELDLTRRLELARKNSQNQHGKEAAALSLEKPIEDTIYEEEPPPPTRPASRASRAQSRTRPTTPGPDDLGSPRSPRSASLHSNERRPMGPRSPSPLPPKTPPKHLTTASLPSMDVDLYLEDTLVNPHSRLLPETPSREEDDFASPLPRSRRQPLTRTENSETTPRPAVNGAPATPSMVEPLSIKKKTSVRSSVNGTPTPARRANKRNSPMSRPKVISPRRVSPQVIRNGRSAQSMVASSSKSEVVEHLVQLSQTTKEDVDSSRRAVKRIKIEVDGLRAELQHGTNEGWRSPSPEKGGAPRTPQRGGTPMTKAAQERMEEMRQLIQKRQGEGTPRSRSRNGFAMDDPQPQSSDKLDRFAKSVEGLVSDADRDLLRAASNIETIQNDIRQVATEFKAKASDLEKTRIELQNTKRQCELVKSLLTDATAEKEIMYDAFNEELDGMYNDAHLPEDEAWRAMTLDLRQTKEARNLLNRENSQLKRRLAEVEAQKEEWGDLLRSHGLI
ncbi:hypothetical protein PLICRDRAFT_33706 [Plicaturopsis crispa FD-325 SS-3]|nr:hypothetical protein PLICRDRAFT_33706 [Plicaturopsis crispa FD-325 SS-3]